jgi:ABC-type glycerol-3-phosphate transport system substrate-binding protein
MHTPTLRAALAGAALAALAACGGAEKAASDSAAAAASPDSAGLQTTPPQPNGPMNMVDSASRSPTTADSPATGGDTLRTPGKAP